MARRSRDAPAPHADDLLGFANDLVHRIKASRIDQNLCSSLRTRIGRKAQHATSRTAEDRWRYDTKGTEIWNSTNRLTSRDSGVINTFRPLAQAFAVALLDRAYRQSSRDRDGKQERAVRILRTSLKATKSCIAATELDIATEILQSAADYVAILEPDGKHAQQTEQTPADVVAHDLIAEYWLTRATLSWKQQRLDLTVRHLQRHPVASTLSPDVLEKHADLACAIAADLQNDPPQAIEWLQRAATALEHILSEDASLEVSGLRTTIMRDLARAYLKQGDNESVDRAGDIVTCLEQEMGPKIGVLLLKFDLITQQSPVSASEYQVVLLQIMRSAIITANTFKAVLLHTRKLHALDASLARRSLDMFVTTRLLEHGDRALIEKALVFRIWTCTSESTNSDVVVGLQNVIEEIRSSIPNAVIGLDATHAALTLCWKAIDSCTQSQNLDVADAWCKLALSEAFAGSGDLNKAKIARKRMVVALSAGKVAVAREAFYQIPEPCQKALSSRYLLYKVALHEADDATIKQCLSSIAASSNDDTSFLYGCVNEARQLGTRSQAVSAIQTVLSLPQNGSASGSQQLLLSRCAIQMIIKELEGDRKKATSMLHDVVPLFEAAVGVCEGLPDAVDDELVIEIQWHAKTSYNLALEHVNGVEHAVVLSLLDSCLALCQRLTTSDDASHQSHLLERIALCHYLGALINVILARSQDHIDSSKELYAHVLCHCHAFTSTTQSATELSPDEATVSHASELLRYEIEALIRLQDWPSLSTLFSNLISSDLPLDLDLLADLVITAHAVMVEQNAPTEYAENIPSLLQAIINASFATSGTDMHRLARWLRCVFRMTSASTPEVAVRVLAQVGGMVVRHRGLGEGREYPGEEVEWLASTAFNTAVDRCCAGDEGGCRMWAEAALNLAREAVECRGLYAQMQGLWRRLEGQLGRE